MSRALGAGLAGLAIAGALVAGPAVARNGADDPPGDDSRPGRVDDRRGGGNDVRVAGTCTLRSSSKLKLSEENGGLEVEFEVDENRVGKAWRAGISVNGRTVATRRAVTRAPSGSFEVRAVVGAPSGARVAAVARRAATGEVCRAAATAP
jgi:hypothetical protein